jgi:hypothetical protein
MVLASLLFSYAFLDDSSFVTRPADVKEAPRDSAQLCPHGTYVTRQERMIPVARFISAVFSKVTMLW